MIVKKLPTLGDNFYILSNGPGTTSKECYKKVTREKIKWSGDLNSDATLLGRTIVVLDADSGDIFEYNPLGTGYIFLYQYNYYTFGIISELTSNNQYRLGFPKNHPLYQRILAL